MLTREGRGPGGPEGDRADGANAKLGRRLLPDEVTQYPDAGRYDPHVLRTLFFVFENQDWEQELEDFHHTGVEVPATLIVDGQTYPGVGMRFRGGSSYGVPRGKKRSFNVTLDLVDKKQRLLGYKTLNLLNSHTDPSFLRTVLHDHIARQYVPALQANLVRVVINGESWGVYVNEEQYNKDFVRTGFGEDSGARWKIPPDFSGAAALVYHGDNIADYRGLYELKSKDDERSWRDLIGLCRVLEQVSDEQLETDLDRVLNVDRALWFLALDNVLMDEDGYFSRGSDYAIYEDARYKRFHVLPHDSNETFRPHGGPGGPGGPGGRGGPGAPPGGPGGVPGPGGGPDPMDMFSMFGGPGSPGGGPGGGEGGMQEPLSMIQNPMRPLIRRLLSNDHLRARYLAHVQTIVDQRREYLLQHAELAKPRPEILAVAAAGEPQAGTPVRVVAQVGQKVPVEAVLLYVAVGQGAPFQPVTMQAEAEPAGADNKARPYAALIPQAAAGSEVSYYVEARADSSIGTTAFCPARAEMGAVQYRVGRPAVAQAKAGSATLMISKLSKGGESLLLVDSDSRSNAMLDAVDFPSQRDDISWGRSPDGQSPWQPLEPTPGKPNSAP